MYQANLISKLGPKTTGSVGLRRMEFDSSANPLHRERPHRKHLGRFLRYVRILLRLSTSKPFQLNPDPNFYFGSQQHRRAQAYLEYGMHQNEGLYRHYR